jgi:cysteinyl-tRNA synthetase
MLRTHYRQPIDWTVKSLEETASMLESFSAETTDAKAGDLSPEFVETLCDDLNVSGALAQLHVLRKNGRIEELKSALNLLGLSGVAKTKTIKVSREKIVRLVEDRLVARHTKNWAESDRIRDELAAMGIEIKDHKDGTTSWEVKK